MAVAGSSSVGFLMSTGNILVVAGEVSGDLHVAPVISELKRLNPDLSFWGTGGPLMREAGVELLAEIEDLAVMGFSDIPRVLPFLSRLRRTILKQVKERNTSLVILVDYPGFNLNLARVLKRLDNPPKILYYIAPQVWAWRPGRIKEMRDVIDCLAVVFQFEVDLFRAEGVAVEFVGHPLLDELSEYLQMDSRKKHSDMPLLALLPGSRAQEIKRHLPVMIEAAERLRGKHSEIEVAVGIAPSLDERYYTAIVGEREWVVRYKDSHRLMLDATMAAVCSGTATLEAALLGTPQVVVYRTSPLNYLIARKFIKLDRIALVNVVAGREIVKELLQKNLTSRALADELEILLNNPARQAEIKEAYRTVREKLGESGAAGRVARMAMELV